MVASAECVVVLARRGSCPSTITRRRLTLSSIMVVIWVGESLCQLTGPYREQEGDGKANKRTSLPVQDLNGRRQPLSTMLIPLSPLSELQYSIYDSKLCTYFTSDMSSAILLSSSLCELIPSLYSPHSGLVKRYTISSYSTHN